MHQTLPVTNFYYQIFMIEKTERFVFNRGFLSNIGYLEALKEMDFDCFIFHDMDLLPEWPDSRYTCQKEQPTKLVDSISIYNKNTDDL